MTILHPNYTYWTYQYLDLVFPSVLSGFTLIYLVISFLLFRSKNCRDGEISHCCTDSCFSDIIYPYTKVVFRSSLKKESNDGGSTYKYKLHRHEINRFWMVLLSPLTLLIISLGFFAFWDTFLIRQSYGCNQQLDCFKLVNSLPHIRPIDNCMHLNTTENIICFEFVFDLVGGFSSAVGVVGISVFYFNMNLTILNWLVRNYDRSCGFKVCYILTAFFIIALPSTIILLSIIVVLKYLDFFEKSDLFHYEVLIYCTGFVILSIISTVMSCANRVRLRADYERLPTN